ncbi:MAG: 50S ribosomal protein L11 methyltransferase [Ruminococcaceae bacterium]|nr:50S ribosomal protein L11 methyltransferase [Oscillospiraceae bacterium]
MEWTQIRVTCSIEELDTVSAVMSMVDNSLMVEDYSDIEENLMTVYGELIDESILNSDKTIAKASIFIPEEKSLSDAVAFLRERFLNLGLDVKLELVGLDEEDWANEWKKFYHPIHIGKNIVVTPPWEKYEAKEGETVVLMDPGMAFGTGTHETTRLCLTMLEKYLQKGDKILDVGTGSGILSIAASLLGSGDIYAYDIDPVAVRVARENVRDNGCTNITCGESDLLAGVETDGFDLVLANIVADIILRMVGDLHKYIKPGALVVTSGIIIQKSDEVKDAFLANGYELADMLPENDWVSFVFRKL